MPCRTNTIPLAFIPLVCPVSGQTGKWPRSNSKHIPDHMSQLYCANTAKLLEKEAAKGFCRGREVVASIAYSLEEIDG